MLILPAIDLREGKCVRLVEGRLDQETVYSHDPAETGRLWQNQGAQFIHVVDLDGAFSGHPANRISIKRILEAVDVPIQVGGGIREMSDIEELLAMGVNRVILGTAAIMNPDLVALACRRYGEQIVVGIDGRDGMVAIEGWGMTVEKSTTELAQAMHNLGIKRVVFTDIRRDGTLKGPNLPATGALARATGLKVIASGGVSSLDDIRAIKQMEPDGVEGAIMGKALYSGAVSLAEALAITR